MSSVQISGNASGAGVLTIAAPNTASNYTLTLPTATTTLAGTDATQTLTNKTLTSPTMTGAVVSSMASSVITQSTSVATTSGTSIDFTSIPSWVKRVTLMLNGVSTSGTSQFLVQIGAGSITNTGYVSGAVAAQNGAVSSGAVTSTAGFLANAAINTAAGLQTGTVTILNFSGNIWVASTVVAQTDGTRGNIGGGSVTLGGSLDRVRLTTVNGTDTFDAGSINILYE